MLSEFDMITRYFTRSPKHGEQIALGVGDDCALLTPTRGTQLAVSTDMLIEGRHFFPQADARQLGHKCLAVNLSDLAAMGAKPLAFNLALALPEADTEWLAGFSRGMLDLADLYGCDLIGGDTTKGPLTICITIFGEIPVGRELCRDGARAGDDIWVSGSLGEARLALAAYRGEVSLDTEALGAAGRRMHMPMPRIALGLNLRGIASSAIDVSDGLAGDLQHILNRSQVGATVQVDSLPAGPVLRRQAADLQRKYCLAGGDDYELCFTANPAKRNEVLQAAQDAAINVSRIGVIEMAAGLRLFDQSGQQIVDFPASFDHFNTP